MDKRQVWILRGLNLGYFSTMGIMLPLMPLYFSLQGYDSAQVGLFMVVGPFLAVFSQPLWGFISDKLKSVKKIVIFLWFVTVLCSIGVFYANSFWTTLLAISALFFFMMPSAPLLDSASVQVSQQTGVSYGSIRLWGSLGFAIVAIASAYLLLLVGGMENIRYLYWAFWIFPLVLIFFLKDQQASSKTITLRSLKDVMSREFVWFLLMVGLIATTHRMSDSLLPLYLKSLGGNEALVSWSFGLAAMAEIAAFIIIPRILHRFHELGMMAVAAALYAIRWVLYSMIDDPAVIMVLSTMHVVTFGMYWVVIMQYVGRIVPSHFRSTGIALMTAVHAGIGGLVGGYGGGLVMDRLGGDVMYMIAAGVVGTAAVLLALTRWKQKRGQS